MINIQIWRRPAGPILRFRLEGHSGYAPWGQDIVCSAVSALAQSAVLGLMEVANVEVKVEVDAAIGLLDCKILSKASFGDESAVQQAAILETMVLGLRQIQTQYQDYVTMNEKTIDR